MTHQKYAGVFGISTNYNTANEADFHQALRDFVAAPSTVRIDVTYMKQPVIMYSDYDSRIVVICKPDGAFRSVLEMKPKQFWHLWHDNYLGGGR